METIIRHIESLLAEHDCVILPRFGAFIVNHVSAVIDESEEQLIPPHEIIYFNHSLQHDDGLLIETWRLKEKVSYQKASRKIEKFVLQLKQQLMDRQPVEFGELGTFRIGEHQRFEFQPASTLPFLPDNLGLDAIKMPPIRKHRKHEHEVIIHVPAIGKYIAAAVVMILLMFILPIGQFHTETNYAKLNPWDYLKNQWISQHFNINSNNIHNVSLAQPQTVYPFSEPTSTASQKMDSLTASHDWYIVVGTFHSEKQAWISAKQLQEEGKLALTVMKHHDLYRIVAQSFASRDSALTTLRLLRKKPIFSTAWIVYNPSSSSRSANL